MGGGRGAGGGGRALLLGRCPREIGGDLGGADVGSAERECAEAAALRVVPRGAEFQAARALERLAGQAEGLLAHAYLSGAVARGVPAAPTGPAVGAEETARAAQLQRASLPILAAEAQRLLHLGRQDGE